jgi:hypothetical protein
MPAWNMVTLEIHRSFIGHHAGNCLCRSVKSMLRACAVRAKEVCGGKIRNIRFGTLPPIKLSKVKMDGFLVATVRH